MLVKHKAEVISMVLTSFNQKAYEKDLYEEGVEEGINLGQKEIASFRQLSGADCSADRN